MNTRATPHSAVAGRSSRAPWPRRAAPQRGSDGTATAHDAAPLVEAFLDLGCADSAPVFAALAAIRARAGADLRLVVRHGPPGRRGDGGSACAEVALAAARCGRLWEFVARVLAEPRAPDRRRLLQLAGAAGLDPTGIEADLWDGRYRADVRRAQERARRLGVRASPAVFVAGRRVALSPTPARMAARIARRLDGGFARLGPT